MATITHIQTPDGVVHNIGGGGGSTTYTLTKSGSTITLTGSGGDVSSVVDANTTYSLSLSGHTLTLTPSSGSAQSVTIPDDNTTYTIGISGTTITLTPSSGSAQTVTIPDATTTSAGVMSASDKTKLNGIESGAEVNVQADWNQSDSSADDYIKNKPNITSVNDATLTIQKNGNTVETFTANSSTNKTANITVPTKTSELTNDSGFITTDEDTTYSLSETDGVVTLTGSDGSTSTVNTVTDVEVNGSSVVTDGVASVTVPTATSDLTNDSGFLSSESDPVFTSSPAYGITSGDITSWNGKSTVSYTQNTPSGTNIGAITIEGTTTQIYAPSSGGGSVNDVEVNGTSVVTGGVAQVTVPTATSELVNDSGFIAEDANGDASITNDLSVGGVIESENLPGIIKMYAGTFAPTGWLFCNGDEVLVADYPALYDVIGNTYGTPSDPDHFLLPDFRGRSPIGTGFGTATGATNHALGQKSGAETHTLTVDQMPSHTHVQNQHRHSTNYYVSTGSGSQAAYTTTSNRARTQVYTNYETPTNQNTGGGQAHNNMQPFIAVNYIISTGNVSRWADSAGLPIVRDVTVNGQSVVNNEIASIPTGHVVSSYLSTAKNLTSGTAAMLCSITLDAGVWLVTWGARFATNASGYRSANISLTSGANDLNLSQPPCSGIATQICRSTIVILAEQKTYYLNAFQNSGSTIQAPASGDNYGNFIKAIRIA